MPDLVKLAYLANLPAAASAAQDWFSGAVSRVRSLVSPQPQAYSRITRTPIYIQDPGGGLAGQYKDGAITVSPQHLDKIPHESAHALFDQANLKTKAADLARAVPEGARNRILADPVYQAQPDYNTPGELADEGLAYSIGDPDRAKYVDQAAGAIADPTLADRLRRLNWTATNAKPLE